MNWRRVKSIKSLFSQIKIHQCRETKRQIRSGKLSVISFKEIGMLLNRIVVERAHIADMHVRIDQTRNKKPSASIDLLCVCAGNKIGSNLCNPPVTNDNNSVGEGNRALGRDDGHILNHRSVVHDLPFGGVRASEGIENQSN